MEKIRIAALDIGTNTILMMIADKYLNGQINIIDDQHAIARLGENVSKTKKIQEYALKRALDILERYKVLINTLNVNQIRAVATSAMRDANNANDAVKLFEDILESEVKIITGEQEAFLSFIGAIEDNQPSIVVDIGGGSTEIIFGENAQIKSSKSIDIGAVRMTESFFTSQPPKENEIIMAEHYINQVIKQNIDFCHFEKFYGVGGTFTTIASISQSIYDFERKKLSNIVLSFTDFFDVYNTLKSSTIDDIVHKYKVHPMRADVITAGALIALKILEHFQTNKCIISPYGLRYGLIKIDKL